MKRFQLAVAFVACGLATSAMAMPSSYNLMNGPTATTGGAGTNNGTTFANTSSSQYCFAGSSGCTTGGGSDYGNTYTWSAAASGGNAAVTMSAWGSQTKSTSSTIQKAFIGNYAGAGYGVTSQSSGELNSSNQPDASSPNYQHAIDNVNAYESLMFSFSKAVTLNSLSIGFTGQGAGGTGQVKPDLTVLEYTGSGNPMTNLVAGETYAQLLTNGWSIAGNLLGVNQYSTDALSGGTASSYWMVGAYLPIGSNPADPAGASNYSFKIEGFSATSAVPEPGSIALFGIAGVALFGARRRRKAAA